MATLLDERDRQAILARLERMTSRHQARWGRLTAHAMVCHIGDSLAVATGELPCARQDDWLSRAVGKWLVIRSPLPVPRAKIQTAAEMLSTSPTDWSADLARCRELIGRVGARGATAAHPAFGPLSPADWGRLAWKHLDHHLRQFGE